MSSGYSQSVIYKDAKTMAERFKVRTGLRHRLLMFWPPYDRRGFCWENLMTVRSRTLKTMEGK